MNEIENEIISKAGFLLYVDYWDKYFCKMNGEQIKETMQIIFHFNKTCEILKTNDLAIDMVVSTIIDNIKRDASKRIKQSKASRENGAMGGRPPKDKKPSKNPPQPKKTQSVNPTLQEVKDYCLERKNLVNPEKWINHYEANGWKVGKNSMKNWKACIRTWENSDYNNLAPKNDLLIKLNLIAGFDAFKSIEEGEESVSLYAIDTLKVSALADETKDKIKAQFINKKIILR